MLICLGCSTSQDQAPMRCEVVSNRTRQQTLALPKKEVIQPHLSVRISYYFTPITNPAFGISLLTIKVTTSGMTYSHSVTGSVYKA
ncbi:hypothetical protein Ahy_B04g069111 [Arachis hypogaea]|uniref:Uncharacterized protein n=1 Tax=Arachis hypogaea TaxID=3818 RepID=A0A444ZBR0_ARAHY|nr:hypothetical protein Ahy_B04g069111 [Arachis hypogaea]